MPMSKEQIFTEAMTLEPHDRQALGEELLQSVDQILDPEWAAEIQRRVDEIKRGKAKLIPVDQAVERLRAKYSK